MSMTLIEASRLATDVLKKGLLESVVMDSPVLQQLPFIEVVGNALRYNREKFPPPGAWYAPQDAWAGATAQEFEPMEAIVGILGQDADVDQYLKSTRANVQDIEAIAIAQAAKGIRHGFEDMFINGDPTVTPNQPAGLRSLIGGEAWQAATAYALGDIVVPEEGEENGFRYECVVAGTSDAAAPAWPIVHGDTVVDDTAEWICRFGGHMASGVNGDVLTLSRLDQLIDLVLGGKPDMLLMSKRSRRELQNLSRAAGSNLQVGTGKLGETVEFYNGIPVYPNDWIPNNLEVGGSGTVCSLVFALKLGTDAVCGLTNSGLIQYERIGVLEGFDATRTRIKWYCGLAAFSAVNAAMLSGVTPA
ncbi:MAG: phage major capsid protein [Dehalococcoidia bacterium]